MSTARDVTQALAAIADPARISHTSYFFKSKPGDYSENDQFLGIRVPDCRAIAKLHTDISLAELKKVLQSPWHEERETALFILVRQYSKATVEQRAVLYDFYLEHTAYVNNWDLVDASARDIIGWHTFDNPDLASDLDRLAASSDLWEKRIAMVATWYALTKKDPDPTLRIAEKLLYDPHDLIQKAVGWMLREMGKRVDRETLVTFLAKHYTTMPRTTLRYAIEHFDPDTRQRYLKGTIV